MDWDRYNELSKLGYSGNPEQALSGFYDLEAKCQDTGDKVAVLLAISNCLVLLNRYTEARQTLDKAFAAVGKRDDTCYPRIAFKDAYIDIYLRNWKAALHKIEKLLKESSRALQRADNADLIEELRIAQGIVLVELHQYREAIPLLEEASKARSDHGTVLIYLGACYFDVKDLERSRGCFTKALTLDLNPNLRSRAHFFLGSIHYAQGNFAWAKQEFEEAIRQGEPGEFANRNAYDFLKRTSEYLGLDGEVERYSQLLQTLDQPSKR